MELRNEGAQFFEEGNADLIEVLLGTAGGSKAGINSAKVGDVAVESNGPGLRGDLPFGRAKKNGDVPCVNGGDTRGNGFRFERMIDSREHDGVVCDMDDGSAAGEVGDDFVFLCVKWESEEKKQPELEKEESQRVLTISYLIDLRREEGSGGGFREALVPVDFK